MTGSVSRSVSRRGFVGLCAAGAALGATPAWAQLAPAAFPAVGAVRVKAVSITGVGPLAAKSQPFIGQVDVGHAKGGLCAIGIDGGIHFQANVELEARAAAKLMSYGALTLAQNTIYHHKRESASAECANAAGWTLDGQYPYQNKRVPCRPGSNRIVHDDGPNVIVEPYEHVWVEPEDQFRTFVIWEITPNNLAPSVSNPPLRVVLARVDWMWQGEAVDAGAATPGVPCKSGNHGWGTAGPTGAKIVRVATGAGVNMPLATGRPIAPVYSPLATPDAWVPC